MGQRSGSGGRAAGGADSHSNAKSEISGCWEMHFTGARCSGPGPGNPVLGKPVVSHQLQFPISRGF